MNSQDYYVVLYNGDTEIANSMNGAISSNDIMSATSYVVHNISDNTDVVYNNKLNKNGTLSSLDGSSVLKRTEIMSLFGGGDNYNTMLSVSNLAAPTMLESADATTVLINGEQVKPTFMVYADGQVYINGIDTPISKKQLKEQFPETYNKIWRLSESMDSFSGEVEATVSGPTNTGGGNSNPSQSGGGGTSSQPTAPENSGDNPQDTTPTTPTTPETGGDNGTNSGTDTNPNDTGTGSIDGTNTGSGGGSGMAPSGGGGTDLLVDYSSIATVVSTVNASLTKFNGILDGYNALGKVIEGGSIWDGEEIGKFTEATSSYGTYFTEIGNGLKELNESLNKISELFETTEQEIGK